MNGVQTYKPQPRNGYNKLIKGIKKNKTQAQIKRIRDTIEGLIQTSSKKACAKFLGISEVALYKRLSQYPEIMEGVSSFVDEVRDDSRRKIILRSPKSVDKVIEFADSAKSENVGLQANLELLDRAGIVKPTNDNNIQVNILNNLKEDKDKYK